jgi:hypothetical protein
MARLRSEAKAGVELARNVASGEWRVDIVSEFARTL